MNAHTTVDSAPEKIFPALADLPSLADLTDLHNSLVFWMRVKCGIAFVVGFGLGLCF